MPHHSRKRSRGGARNQWRRQIARFCDIWLCASNRSEKTIRAYRADLKQFAKQLPKSVGPRGVRNPMVEGWVAKLQKRDYSASSIRRKLASLRAFYAYLITTGRTATSPLSKVHIRLGETKRLTRVVLRRDLRALVAAADREAGRYRCRALTRVQRIKRLRNTLIVRLLCVTGIRVGELVSLRLSDVRQRERTLLITGKGNRERLAYIADPYTAALLERYLSARHHNSEGEALFPRGKSANMSTENIRRVLRDLARSAQIHVRITPHMLRHTAATTLLENGADLRVVQEFLGHRSIRSTERYTYVSPAYLHRVLRRTNPLRRVA